MIIIKKFANFISKLPRWQKFLGPILALFIILGLFIIFSGSKDRRSSIKYTVITRGEVHTEVTASGNLRARNTVEVGTQISGTIARLYADYNSRVRKGQLLALLDTTFLQASVLDAQANFQKADAQLLLAENAKKRSQALFEQKLIPEIDWETVLAQYQSAVAARTSALAQLERARINLSYAYIRSPIDGIVISRNVEVGQTVAASLNAPTLFVIADDLSKMQIQAMVDEGDIGSVAIGQRARFTVDAYPDRTFEGRVSNIYLQPTTIQNVVSYTAIIEVDNQEMLLKPGMTANVTIITQEAKNSLLVPVAALEFKPSKDAKSSKEASNARASKPVYSLRSNPSGNEPTARRQYPASQADESKGKFDRSQNVIFVYKSGQLRPEPVKVLLKNGIMAAIEGNVAEGDSVAVGYHQTAGRKSKTAARSPFQPAPPPGGPRRF